MIFDYLKQFRQSAYTLLGKGKDAVFDLMDAVLTSPRLNSCSGTVTVASVTTTAGQVCMPSLRSSRPQRRKLIRLGIEQMPTEQRPMFAGDHTAWSRSYARTLRDRTIEHQPTLRAGNKPIAVGHGFSTLAWIPEAQGSWALPLRHERITSFETPLSRAAFQGKACLLFSWKCDQSPQMNSEYGNASNLHADSRN